MKKLLFSLIFVSILTVAGLFSSGGAADVAANDDAGIRDSIQYSPFSFETSYVPHSLLLMSDDAGIRD